MCCVPDIGKVERAPGVRDTQHDCDASGVTIVHRLNRLTSSGRVIVCNFNQVNKSS